MRDFPPGYSAQVANIAAKVIFEMRDQFDLIAISGDLATTGHTECLATARQFTHSAAHTKWLNSERKPTLQAANKGMILVPGNHDRYADNKGAPGGRNFDSVYEDEWPKPRRYVQHRIIEKDNERVACIGVDFCLRAEKDAGRPYSSNRWGRGKAYENAIRNLVDRTKAARRKYKNIAVIWIVHFPAMASTPGRYRLNDAHKLIEAASRQKIPLILSGHLHESIAATVGGNIAVLCAGSMTAIGDESWMHFVNLEVEKGSISACSKIDFKFSEERRNFVREKTYSVIVAHSLAHATNARIREDNFTAIDRPK